MEMLRRLKRQCCVHVLLTTNSITTIKLVGYGIEIRVLRQRLVKRSIKDRNLRKSDPEYLACRLNPLDVGGIVERSQLDAILNCS